MRSAAPKNIAPSKRSSAISSSPGRCGPGNSSRTTLLRRATLRSAKNAATTMPISTASIRSKHTVTTAVSTNVNASERVERTILRTVRAGDHPERRHHQHTRQRGQRNRRHRSGGQIDHREQNRRVHDRRQPGAGAGADVDRGAGDRAGGGHPAEHPRRDRGQPLPDQFAVGVVGAGRRHRRRDPRRQQRFDRGQRGDRHRGADQVAQRAEVGVREHGRGQVRRQFADRGHRESRAATTSTVAATTAVSDSGIPRCSRGRPIISSATKATTPGFSRPAPVGVVTMRQAAGRVRSPAGPVAPNAAGTCCRKMMAAMPKVKPSITGHGMNVTARPRPVTPAATHDDSGQHGDQGDAAEPVLRHDRRQHDRHRTGRSRHLDV